MIVVTGEVIVVTLSTNSTMFTNFACSLISLNAVQESEQIFSENWLVDSEVQQRSITINVDNQSDSWTLFLQLKCYYNDKMQRPSHTSHIRLA